MANEMKSVVTVNLLVQVAVNSTWGADTTLAQIQRQAKEEAERTVKKALTNKVHIMGGTTTTIVSKLEKQYAIS